MIVRVRKMEGGRIYRVLIKVGIGIGVELMGHLISILHGIERDPMTDDTHHATQSNTAKEEIASASTEIAKTALPN